VREIKATIAYRSYDGNTDEIFFMANKMDLLAHFFYRVDYSGRKYFFVREKSLREIVPSQNGIGSRQYCASVAAGLGSDCGLEF
jgi:hypothetical protein